MTQERIKDLLRKGEGLAIEFKRCAGKIEHDVFESICAFLNRFGGDVLLGVENDGTVVGVNLVAAYDRLMDFARKHLPDPFFLEGDIRKSLREIIVREMVANTLIHREFTSSRPARFVIERDRMYVENACRASSGDILTPDNFTPDPRNPIIANFFRIIGYADQLGSGVRNLYKYAKAYGGADPKLTDGDVFRIEVSLKSIEIAPIGSEVAQKSPEVAQKGSEVAQKSPEVAQKLTGKGRGDAVENALAVFNAIYADGNISIAEIESITQLSNGSVKNAIRMLRTNGIIMREGADRGGKWTVLI